MKKKIIQIVVTALLTTAIILALQAILPEGSPSLASRADAQNIITGQIYTLNQDTFVIAASQTGAEVFVYYFDARPEEEKSTLEYITMAKAR